ncbi:sensor histidine kinase [Kaarinaea lacus]
MTSPTKTSISLRARLIAGMLLLAIAGFSLVLATGYIYRDLAYQNQRNAITELIGLKITNILDELSEISKIFGMELQSIPELRTAIKDKNLEEVTRLLNGQFKRYFVTTGMLKLKDIYVFDENFDFMVSSSSANIKTKNAQQLSCSDLTAIAKKRVGAQRLKPMSQLCTRNYESLFGVIVPVGTLAPFAYMLLVSDPAHNVIQLEETLGDPIRILRYSDEVVYQSPNWPVPDDMDDYLVSHHILRAPNGTTLLKTQAARDIEPYRKQLVEYTAVIVLISLVIFGLVLAALMYTLRKTLRPLDELKSAATELIKGKHIKVEQTSVPEIDVVINSYNKMSEDITNLIKKLKNEIIEHKKTESNLKQHQHDLSLARDQAFAASRAKSTFLANMSHELRTPLNAIIGYADMLFEDATDAANHGQISDLEKILASGRHLLSIIDNVLDLSKVESGAVRIEPSEIRIETLIQELKVPIVPIAEINHNNLKINCQPGIGILYTDVKKLRQCILNVLDNACKFTHHGHVTMEVTEEKKNEQDWLKFSVTDTGIGISDEQARKIFSEFTQADSSTTKAYQGIGLGLALSKKFCELVGGHISFVSEEGKGSTFVIIVPKRIKQDLTVDLAGHGHTGFFSQSA